MKRLGPISLPQNPPTDYSRQLSVMLYQYLRQISEQINAAQSAVDELQSVAPNDAQNILANQVFGR